MEGESGGVGRKKMYFVAPGVGIDSLGGFLRSESAYIRTTSVMGGPLACFFFLIRMDRGVRGSSTRGRKHLVRRKKKNDGGGGRSRG